MDRNEMPQTKEKMKVSAKDVLARVNLKLQKQGRVMCKTRGSKNIAAYGQYYIAVTGEDAGIEKTCVVLSTYARELGVLQPWEEVE